MPPETKIPDNSEINQALKEFETKSKAEAASYKAVKFYNETSTPKMVQLVMKLSGGAIKEQKQAEYVLLGFAILAIIISLFLFFGNPFADKPTLIPAMPAAGPGDPNFQP